MTQEINISPPSPEYSGEIAPSLLTSLDTRQTGHVRDIRDTPLGVCPVRAADAETTRDNVPNVPFVPHTKKKFAAARKFLFPVFARIFYCPWPELRGVHHPALFSGYVATYNGVNYRFPNNLPFMHVAPVRLEGNKPATIDKSLGRVDRAFPIPDGVGAVDMDIARADSGLAPMLEPIEELLCGIDLDLLFGGSWSALG